MEIKLHKNQDRKMRKLPKVPEKGSMRVMGALIDCVVDGKESVLNVTFNMHFTVRATVIMRVAVRDSEGYTIESEIYGAIAGGYGYDMTASACSDVFSKVFYDISHTNAERILTGLASRISTKDRFILFSEYGGFAESCKAGAEKVNLV